MRQLSSPYASAGARGLLEGAFGISPDHADFNLLRDDFFNNYEKALLVESKLFDGIDHLLDQMDQAGLPWGIITNKSERFTNPFTDLMGLRQRAISTVSGDTTPYSKPHPEPILHAARSTNIDPTRSIYVGGDIRDVVAGKAAGRRQWQPLMPTVAEKSLLRPWEPITSSIARLTY
ncbi:HAD family hydrolase [Polynucleobacter necessarius]|uniref:HAD family hydrolase n=1 Tax=Polynucleobacter necessarius TaxID=576610 RepID=UPI0018D56E23|nr:HAD-IA family hydrolase [Polynucleobacter necessarius]